ncbi:MAG: GNAT family N-acetyltransferase [Caldilineaceae bacterium]
MEAWEATCFGYCLLHDNAILAEAIVIPALWGYGNRSFHARSTPRKGYGTIVTAHLIHAIESPGDRTYWNCTQENVASAAIARKLGYQVEKAYRFWGWEQQEH